MKISVISKFVLPSVAVISFMFSSCVDFRKDLFGSLEPHSPVLADITVREAVDTSVTIEKASFIDTGNPVPSAYAYIGVSGTISVYGNIVSNVEQGPVDVLLSGCNFSSLSSNTPYDVVVVAENTEGYSVKTATLSPPVLNGVFVSAVGADYLTIEPASFLVAANPPLIGVNAYIGLSGTITVSGSSVSGELQGPYDVSSSGCTFSSLAAGNYVAFIVAQSSFGYSVASVSQSFNPVAPVLDDLVLSAYSNTSITLARPSFSVAGNPLPSYVEAYIGLAGTISASGTVVSNAVQGPVDVSSAGYMFAGLTKNIEYTIIVVTENSSGYSVKQINKYAAGANANEFLSFSISGQTSSVISVNDKTVSVVMPTGTDLSSLIAVFTTNGETVEVGGVTQISGATANNFNTSIVYSITSFSGHAANYTVTVTAP